MGNKISAYYKKKKRQAMSNIVVKIPNEISIIVAFS